MRFRSALRRRPEALRQLEGLVGSYVVEALRELALETARGEFSRIAPTILSTIRQFERGSHATDDKTIVVLRRA